MQQGWHLSVPVLGAGVSMPGAREELIERPTGSFLCSVMTPIPFWRCCFHLTGFNKDLLRVPAVPVLS